MFYYNELILFFPCESDVHKPSQVNPIILPIKFLGRFEALSGVLTLGGPIFSANYSYSIDIYRPLSR